MHTDHIPLKEKQVCLQYRIKGALVGDWNVGKTSICKCLCGYQTDGLTKPTIGVAFYKQTFHIPLPSHKVSEIDTHIWDTAGSEKYRGLLDAYVRDNCIVMFVFDINSPDSFEHLDEWYSYVLKVQKEQQMNPPLVCIVGCKNDVTDGERVTDNDIEQKASEWNCPWWKISTTLPMILSGTPPKFFARETGTKMVLEQQHHYHSDTTLSTREQVFTIFGEMVWRVDQYIKEHGTSKLNSTACSLGKRDPDIVNLYEMEYETDEEEELRLLKKSDNQCC